MAGMELSGEAGAAGRKTASWGRTWVKGFSSTQVALTKLRTRRWGVLNQPSSVSFCCYNPIWSSDRAEFGEGSCFDSETEFRPPVRTCPECRDHP